MSTHFLYQNWKNNAHVHRTTKTRQLNTFHSNIRIYIIIVLFFSVAKNKQFSLIYFPFYIKYIFQYVVLALTLVTL